MRNKTHYFCSSFLNVFIAVLRYYYLYTYRYVKYRKLYGRFYKRRNINLKDLNSQTIVVYTKKKKCYSRSLQLIPLNEMSCDGFQYPIDSYTVFLLFFLILIFSVLYIHSMYNLIFNELTETDNRFYLVSRGNKNNY